MYVETVDYTWFHLAAEGTLQSSYEVHLELFSVFNDLGIDYQMQCQRASGRKTDGQTEDLVWVPKTKSHLKLSHKLSVLFTTLASHCD